MADFTDVANTLVGLVATVVYPNGTSQPSIINAGVKIFQGWPDAGQLDKDLKNSVMNISVWPTPTERAVPMRFYEWQELSIAAPTITMDVDDAEITFGGYVTSGQNILLLIDKKPYGYAAQENDTLQSIATAMATLISADRTASSAGAVLTVPGTHEIIARVGTLGTALRELRRIAKVFQVSIWANCFDKRDPLAAIDVALSRGYRIELQDGTQGILRYVGSNQNDNLQKTGIYRRDLMYSVEYAVTETMTPTQVVTEQTSISIVPLPDGMPVGRIDVNL